jgi:NADPH:quinone reductase-like Zn-dependent oxidoreductase
MKAWVYERYGSPADVLRFDEVGTPVPEGHQVLVRVRASGLNAADWHLMRADPLLVPLRFGLRRPRRPMIAGCDVAGVVEGGRRACHALHAGRPGLRRSGVTGGFAEEGHPKGKVVLSV